MDERRPTGAAFLLTQLGTHAARRFADRVSAVDLTPPQSGLIRAVAQEPGRSQQALAAQLGTPATRLVALVDALEKRGVLERRRNPDDRRLYAVHLTPAGEELLADLGRLAAEHEADLLAPLSPEERRSLAGLLGRVAAAEGLTPGVHPGYRDLPDDDRGPQGAPPCGT
ncbi:MarR family transcriptional regulator [Actinomycetospora endophytica]|uniref:MarR family transcriptional regulator n=1 Tax=Actinomycetospora endophytica TaxID=2291215 RepID=A0ABS8P718_9PSEU|nr:MarR family transcriptional regulator [Actinomycetospora endophytica]MCD2194050.1 MarR family transcriptional regulator [Actinomycetospora endophytica]